MAEPIKIDGLTLDEIERGWRDECQTIIRRLEGQDSILRQLIALARAVQPPTASLADRWNEAIEAAAKAIKRANERMPGITVPASNGDNLAIALCTYFDDGEEPEGDETHWSRAATEGYEQMIAAIREHYIASIRALSRSAGTDTP